MADTGWKSPTAYNVVGYLNDWVAPENALSSDDSWATSVAGEGTEDEDYGSFDFDIPAGAIIDGIELSIEGKSSVGTQPLNVFMSKNGGGAWPVFRDSAVSFGTTESTETSGGSTDKWGTTWTVDALSNANFILWLRNAGDGSVISVDHIQIKVYYTPKIEKELSDAITFTESLSTKPGKIAADSLTPAEAVVKGFGLDLS